MITEQMLREQMRASTDHLVPSAGLLSAAKRTGLRRRRLALAGAATAVIALAGGVGAIAGVHAEHAGVLGQAATHSGPVAQSGWHGSWRVGSADPYWKTGAALATQLRALDHAPRPAGTHADWYVYGTTAHVRFVLDSAGRHLYVSYLCGSAGSDVCTLRLQTLFTSDLPVVVQLPTQLGDQYLAVMPQAALSYQLRHQDYRSDGTTAALIPKNATAIRAVRGSKKWTVELPITVR